MRLTLRTLLAHQDDILEPDDAAEINKKIEESEFASGLVHRLKDVSQRLRLGAPPLEGRGMGLDPNVVAEYLDNTLEADQVPDFEKACLESDVHLAEVASSHQILTLVLGEPAQVDPDSRRRMYALIDGPPGAESSVVPAPHADGVAAPPVQPGEQGAKVTAPPKQTADRTEEHKARHKPEVPDYLREGSAQSNRRKAMATLLIALAASVAVWLYFDGWQDIKQRFAASGDDSQQPTDIDPNARADDLSTDEKSTPDAKTTTGGILDVRPTPFPRPGDIPDEVKQPIGVSPPTAKNGADAIKLPEPDAGPSDVPPDAKPNPKDDIPPAPAPVAAPKLERLGQLRSVKQPLLIFDGESRQWQRLPVNAVINSGSTLLALPTYRPTITLGSLSVQLGGETMIQLEGTDESGAAALRIVYGRVIMQTSGGQETRLRLLIGESQYEATINDADFALHVEPRVTPGVDPQIKPATPQVDLFVTRGNILWKNIDSGKQSQYQGERHVAVAGADRPEIGGLDNFPAWILAEQLKGSEQRASVTHVEPELDVAESIQLRLQELSGHRQREVRSLAARCLGHIGEFDSFVDALDNADEKALWPSHIDSLRAAMARGPRSAKLVRESLERHYSGEAKQLYSILWGYSEEGLRDGGAAKLVEYLSHDKLAVRVLASNMLKRITGLGLYYYPDNPEGKRRTAVRHWTKRLEKGEIVPKGASLRKKKTPEKAASFNRSALRAA